MENLSFFLEGIVKEKNEYQNFEGPLSLILMLLSKNKIEIRDIKIADILDQYLAYLDGMKSMDLEIASEFVQMASHLLYIKTKMLLTGDEEEVSELEVLISSLEQLKSKDTFAALKKVIPALKEASDTGLLYCSKLPEPLPKVVGVYEYRHEPVELLRAIENVFSGGARVRDNEVLMKAVPRRIAYSVKDKSRRILELLKNGTATLNDIYRECTSRSEIVATFMAVLELCSMGSIRFDRREDEDYTLSFAGGNVEEIIEKIVE